MRSRFVYTVGLGCAVAAVCACSLASAETGTIATSFAAEASADGNMFDISIFAVPVTVKSLEVNVSNSGNPLGIAVYTKPGTFLGFETDAEAWTLVSRTTVIPKEFNQPTFVDVADFILPADRVIGMYIVVVPSGPGEPQMHYLVGNRTVSNDDVRLDLGVGIGGTFEYGIEERSWSGTMYYEKGVTP